MDRKRWMKPSKWAHAPSFASPPLSHISHLGSLAFVFSLSPLPPPPYPVNSQRIWMPLQILGHGIDKKETSDGRKWFSNPFRHGDSPTNNKAIAKASFRARFRINRPEDYTRIRSQFNHSLAPPRTVPLSTKKVKKGGSSIRHKNKNRRFVTNRTTIWLN